MVAAILSHFLNTASGEISDLVEDNPIGSSERLPRRLCVSAAACCNSSLLVYLQKLQHINLLPQCAEREFGEPR
jgi:hypothetical protein